MIRSLQILVDPQRTSERAFLARLLMVAFLLRLVWILLVDAQPVSDFSWYFNQGISLSTGRGYIAHNGTPTAFFPVGYPAFLAMLFVALWPSVLLAKLANLVLATGSIAIFYSFARQLTEETEVRRWAVLLITLFPSQIAYCSLLSDSILYQLLLYLGLWLLINASSGRVLLGGFVFGLSVLTRPYGFIIPIIAGLCFWSDLPWSVRLRKLSLAYLAVILVIAPWTIRNYRIFNGFIPISNNAGINLLIGNGPNATGKYDESPLAVLNEHHLDEYHRDQLARKLAIQQIASRPIRFFRLAANKLFYTFADDAQAFRWNLKGMNAENRTISYRSGDYFAMGLFQAFYSLVLLGFILYIILAYPARKRSWRIHPAGLWILLYFTLISMVFFGNPRLHFPITPLLCVYAGVTFHSWLTRPQQLLRSATD